MQLLSARVRCFLLSADFKFASNLASWCKNRNPQFRKRTLWVDHDAQDKERSACVMGVPQEVPGPTSTATSSRQLQRTARSVRGWGGVGGGGGGKPASERQEDFQILPYHFRKVCAGKVKERGKNIVVREALVSSATPHHANLPHCQETSRPSSTITRCGGTATATGTTATRRSCWGRRLSSTAGESGAWASSSCHQVRNLTVRPNTLRTYCTCASWCEFWAYLAYFFFAAKYAPALYRILSTRQGGRKTRVLKSVKAQ